MEIRVKGATIKNRKPYGKERDQRPSQRDNDPDQWTSVQRRNTAMSG